MGIIAEIILLGFFSFVVADPPSQQDYGLCSQVYIMHQYCTSQLSPASTAVSQRAPVQPRVGKAGPRGPRGIVNYTAIDEKIAEKFSAHEDRADRKFDRWRMHEESQVRRMKADIARRTSEWQRMKDQLDQQKTFIDTEMSKMKDEIANETKVIRYLKNLFVCNCEYARRYIHGDGGVMKIVQNGRLYEVYCDMATDGGNWIVFQRRMDGSVDFYRTWEEYASGFGNKSGEFWLGLETIHQLTQDGEYELRVDLTDWDDSTAYAKYRDFSISGRSDGYRLTVRDYSGTAGESMIYHNGYRFSAKDKDLDPWTGNCATRKISAWWFNQCSSSNLNGRYNDSSQNDRGVFWFGWKKRWQYSLKGSEMKFRKK